MARYCWSELAKQLASHGPARIARAILSAVDTADLYFGQGDDVAQALVAATEVNPAGVWTAVGGRLRHGDRSWRLTWRLQGWYGAHVETDVLVEWASQNSPDGPEIAAGICPVRGEPLEDPARTLLIRFPTDEVGWALRDNLKPRVHVVSSEAYEEELGMVEQWCRDEEPAVREWASHLRDSLKREIEDARREEDERGFW